jgi:hypothetical protein
LPEAVVGASRESGNTSDRVKRAKRASAREGYRAGGIRPYGYQLLRRPVLKGVRVRHGTEYPAKWPAIVTPEEWGRVQLILGDVGRLHRRSQQLHPKLPADGIPRMWRSRS